MKEVKLLQARFIAEGVEIPKFISQTGYTGRTGIFTAAEIMNDPTPLIELGEWAASPKGAADIKAALFRKGLRASQISSLTFVN